MGDITELDRNILSELRKNSRITYVALAEAVGACQSERFVPTSGRWRRLARFASTPSERVALD